MNKDLSVLVDPDLGTSLVQNEANQLVNRAGVHYPVVNGVPRLVAQENYAKDFGSQWNKFPKTQLDSYTGIPISELRLARCMQGNLPNIKGRMVLEAGSGAGRFTEVLLKNSAIVHSFDYSSAVEANAHNNGHNEHLTLVQADIRRIPFPKASYDYVVCLGVLQHTPNPEESISCLWQMVKPGGHLVIDHYRWNWGLVLPPPIGGAEKLYRWVILKLSIESRFKLVKGITDFWFPIHWMFRKWPLMQRILVRLSPVHFYFPDYKLRDRKMFYEWALLDTHDGTTDVYKHYRNERQIHKYLEKIGAENIEVKVGGNGVEAFCKKPCLTSG
jgi:2-polyprenyl-3-methyl-5-hydroxy-6-metoxy-1,4-benzoquinol methylase